MKFEIDSQVDAIKNYFELLGGKDLDFSIETANRVRSFGMELDRKRNYEKFTTFVSDCDEMIIGNHLRLFSICEHHLLPFYGEVAIGYIHDGKIFGLSKFQRLVDMVASKPQIQETLTVLEEIKNRLNPTGIGVVVKAVRTCVFARGVQSNKAEFTTNAMYGKFKENPQTRSEFLSCL
ncbi:MAG TPA: GTP cyclohydrolase I [Candidatus Nitrosopolaris sp.]|nr:GTP cyclohydrolase I [Candidatus Nitrosopolaris sp.]